MFVVSSPLPLSLSPFPTSLLFSSPPSPPFPPLSHPSLTSLPSSLLSLPLRPSLPSQDPDCPPLEHRDSCNSHLVEILREENTTLKKELEKYYLRVRKLQKVCTVSHLGNHPSFVAWSFFFF